MPSRDGFGVTLAAVTSGSTSAICDRAALGLKVEVTHAGAHMAALGPRGDCPVTVCRTAKRTSTHAITRSAFGPNPSLKVYLFGPDI